MKTAEDLRRRRFSRNVFVGLALLGFVALIFFVTLVKLKATV